MLLNIIIPLFFIFTFAKLFRKWSNGSDDKPIKLPPGSYGFPLIGETFSFLSASYNSFDVPTFFKHRINKYGPVFKTSLVGQNVIVSADSELNHFIFQQEGRLFECSYPDSFNAILGKENMSNLHGSMHKLLKSLIMNLFAVESLKKTLLQDVDNNTLKFLKNWASKPSVDLRDTVSKMIFNLTANKLISYDPDKCIDDIRMNFDAMIEGLLAFPINIPGTSYNKCLMGRRNTLTILKALLHKRRKFQNFGEMDFFDHIIEELKKDDTLLTEEIALDLMFLLLFASYETTSAALTLAVKFISENPEVLAKLKEEHNEIIRSREKKDDSINWNEYKSMTFTSHVINETLRLANIAPMMGRKAIKDVKTKDGYIIPAGWRVIICPSTSHMDPSNYEDPFTFNPWRWEGKSVNGGTKEFMAFGGGARFCIGADFSKLQMSIFLHHLVTKYRWDVTKGGEIVRTPGLTFPNGLHIQLFEDV